MKNQQVPSTSTTSFGRYQKSVALIISGLQINLRREGIGIYIKKNEENTIQLNFASDINQELLNSL